MSGMKRFLKNRVFIAILGTILPAAADAADLVPITLINDIPFTTVKVGHASARLMIDSGGSLGISMPETMAKTSGSVTLLDSTSKFRDLHGQVYEVRNLVAKEVVIGATRLDPVEGRVHVQWGGAPEGPDAELTKARQAGAIGLAAFGNRPVMFDYRLGNLAIYAPGEDPWAGRQGWQTLRLGYGKEGPSVVFVVNGKPLKFVLDTGTPVNLVNAENLAVASIACRKPASGKPDCDPRSLGNVRDSDGHSLGELKAERVKLGGAPFDGLLGAPFFHEHRVLFDLPGHRLLISPPDVKRGAM